MGQLEGELARRQQILALEKVKDQLSNFDCLPHLHDDLGAERDALVDLHDGRVAATRATFTKYTTQ